MYTIAKSNINDLLKLLTADFQLFVPARTSKNSSGFVNYADGLEVILDKNTSMSPKEIFFPKTEKMYGFKTSGVSLDIDEIDIANNDKIIFGIRPCDARAIDLLDKVFLTNGYEDTFYGKRRQNTLIFSLACSTHNDTCFCESMGLSATDAPNADVMIYDLGDKLGFEGRTDAGKKALDKCKSVLVEGSGTVVPLEPMNIQLNMEGISEKAEKMFENKIWSELATKCIGCSTCSFVCPTCYCFDMKQCVRGDSGVKYRTWDTCMGCDYSMMAGGHDPRPNRASRVRNRFLDKLVYNRQRHGELFCVGCGRCVAKCPVNLEIATAIKKIGEVEL